MSGSEPQLDVQLEVNYYPGCTGRTTERSYVETALMVLRDLGVEAKLREDLPCCGTLEAELADISIQRGLVSIISREAGEVVTGCSGCYSNIIRGGGRARHLLEFLVREVGLDRIRARVKRRLGIRVAPYYGCQALRPATLAIDDPEDPRIFEDLLSAIGAQPVDFDMKSKCCGGPLSLRRPDAAREMAARVVDSAKRGGAQVVATMCNLCHFMLDFNTSSLPIVHFTQLMAYAFGHEYGELGFEGSFNPLPKELLSGDGR